MDTAKLLRPLGWLPSSMSGHRLLHLLDVLHSWYQRRHAAAQAGPARADDSMVELDARTLCDIGAAPAMLARAERRRRARRDRHDELRDGGAGGDWQRW